MVLSEQKQKQNCSPQLNKKNKMENKNNKALYYAVGAIVIIVIAIITCTSNN